MSNESPKKNPVGSVSNVNDIQGGNAKDSSGNLAVGSGILTQEENSNSSSTPENVTGYGQESARHLDDEEAEIVADPEGAKKHIKTPAA
jgi:hypothetical protein